MGIEPEDLVVEPWIGPITMDTGAPEPIIVREGDHVWVGYRAHDPDLPGWNDPSVTEYLSQHEGEPFGVLRFEGVTDCFLGAPNDERLHEHPLYGRGLEFYGFHQIRVPAAGVTRWIVTFHDETLDIRARSASAVPMLFAATAKEAVHSAREAD